MPEARGPGCYTTAGVARGRPRLAERHVRRLRRDAEKLGLVPPPVAACHDALTTLARAAFPRGRGIVRLEVRVGADGIAHLVGTVRPFGDDRRALHAVVASERHPGPGPVLGAKLTARAVLDRAYEQARRAGAGEAILLDGSDRVVEGARTNVVGLDPSGSPWTPPLARGAVAGLAREIVLESLPDVRERDASREELEAAREIVVLNAVRDARAVVRLDGRPVGAGEPGALCARLGRVLADAE